MNIKYSGSIHNSLVMGIYMRTYVYTVIHNVNIYIVGYIRKYNLKIYTLINFEWAY